MADKRRKPRIRKRLRVLYGPQIPSKIGFTSDISETGLCVQTFLVYPPGSVLLLELHLDERHVMRLEGRVHWARKVPPNLLRKVKYAGMGIKILNFLGSPQPYIDLCSPSVPTGQP
ncbi:MAG: PilZ domain-containing protein [Desulfovibrio desulfuricans]|uniref:PilZ domain-containing protein n=1 Tax=Desulfuromonas thiophila TaxID=57664 RepID=UPI0024A94E0C|nr:PilZ domain-containing protein [Desulfuromonas thiophila]MDY0204969.1 PilZ domain-containing protein [Desulfovibrio desulfuricans]